MPFSPLQLVFCADANYAMPLAVTLKSIERSCADPTALGLTVLSIGFTRRLEHLVRASVPHLVVQFKAVDSLLPPDLPEMRWFTRAAYGRLVAPELFDSAERLVYLDTDLLVRTDLTFLAECQLGADALGAVQSSTVPTVSSPLGLVNWRSLGLPPATPYFNSGVLVIDVAAWRRKRLTQLVLDFVERHADTLDLADQDALNAVLRGRFAPLPLRWNQETSLREELHHGFSFFAEPEVVEAVMDPAIVHFTGPRKPWLRDCSDPAALEWWSLLAETPFRRYAVPRLPRREQIAYRLNRALKAGQGQ